MTWNCCSDENNDTPEIMRIKRWYRMGMITREDAIMRCASGGSRGVLEMVVEELRGEGNE